MIGEIFPAGTGALHDLEQQQQDAERKQDIAQRHRPLRAGHQRQRQKRLGESHAGHQEGDDVVDRERNQEERETDHGHRRGLLFKHRMFSGKPIRGSQQKTVLPQSLAEFRQVLPVGPGSASRYGV